MAQGVYTLKLELPDGRWSIDEAELDARPQVGQLVELEASWEVLRVERVPVRVGHKRDRELFVCAPV